MSYELITEKDKIKTLVKDHPVILKTLKELGIREINDDLTVKDIAEQLKEDPDIISAKLNIAVFGMREKKQPIDPSNVFKFEEE